MLDDFCAAHDRLFSSALGLPEFQNNVLGSK